MSAATRAGALQAVKQLLADLSQTVALLEPEDTPEQAYDGLGDACDGLLRARKALESVRDAQGAS